jgi:hypothetical protein
MSAPKTPRRMTGYEFAFFHYVVAIGLEMGIVYGPGYWEWIHSLKGGGWTCGRCRVNWLDLQRSMSP